MLVSLDARAEALLEAALGEASRRGHAVCTVEHLVSAALRDPVATGLLRDSGAHVGRALREIVEYLEILEGHPASPGFAPRLDHLLERTLLAAAARAQAGGREAVEIADLLAALVKAAPESFAAATLDGVGAGRIEILRTMTHGPAWRGARNYEDAAPGERLFVLMHNDCYTTMDFVVAVLHEVFDLSERHAVELMLTIHRLGFAVIGAYPRDEARDKVARVGHLAEEADFPLLCTLVSEAERLAQRG